MNPNYDFDKPNKLTFKMMLPTEPKERHLSDAELNPGKWVFYDVNLDAVREELAKNVYMGTSIEDRDGFAEREEF